MPGDRSDMLRGEPVVQFGRDEPHSPRMTVSCPVSPDIGFAPSSKLEVARSLPRSRSWTRYPRSHLAMSPAHDQTAAVTISDTHEHHLIAPALLGLKKSFLLAPCPRRRALRDWQCPRVERRREQARDRWRVREREASRTAVNEAKTPATPFCAGVSRLNRG